MQVAEAVHRYGRGLDARVLPIYGGQAIGQQLRALRRGVDVVVATPGRAVDHLTRGSLSFDAVEVVVLDEADEMLDMGFAEDLEAILAATPAGRQTALFSATISPTIARIAARHLREPVRVAVRPERPAHEEMPRVRQRVYVVRGADKLAALGRILDLEDPASALVFARTRVEVDDLAEALAGRGHDVAALHGGMCQEQRDRVMGRFRDGSLDVLVATDVAARGLDIEHVSHVVNFDVPSDPDMYIHRIGRTGRMGREGVAITLLEPREHRLLRNIEAATRTKLELATIPTVADLRERRLELLQASLRERLLEEGLERYRGVVEPLADEFDLVEIALAAISLLEGANARDVEEVEIAPASLPVDRPAAPGSASRPPRVRARAGRSGRPWRPAAARRAAGSRARPGPRGARGAPGRDVEWATGVRSLGPPVRGRRPPRRHAPGRPGRRDRERGRAFRAPRSARSRSPTPSRSSTWPIRRPIASSPPCAAPRSAAAPSRSTATATPDRHSRPGPRRRPAPFPPGSADGTIRGRPSRHLVRGPSEPLRRPDARTRDDPSG